VRVRSIVPYLALLAAAGCALYSEVSIGPLMLEQGKLERGSNLQEMVETGDFNRAVQMARAFDSREKPAARDLALLGKAELAAGRFDSARRRLRQALDLKLNFQLEADVAWDLSQVEYLSNNYEASRVWADHAIRNGTRVMQWHLSFLDALSNVQTYRMSRTEPTRMAMHFGKPDIPRVEILANGSHEAIAVIDSGAVLSIISEDFARQAEVRSLGDFGGTFYGLLGEPIPVRFGLLETVQLGGIVVSNVPVAIMPDRKLHFFVYNREPFRMDVLIGANFLKEFRTTFDYREGTVTFAPLTAEMRRPADNQNMFFVNFRPLVHTTINRRGWYLFLIDTGSEVTFLNEQLISKTAVRYAPKVHGANLQGLGGAQQTGQKIENVEIGVDRWAGLFKNLPLYGNESTNALGILGQNLLKHFVVVMDFGTMRLELQRQRSPFGL
jgi:hypothetical protein